MALFFLPAYAVSPTAPSCFGYSSGQLCAESYSFPDRSGNALLHEMIGEVSYVLVYQTGSLLTRGQVLLQQPSSVLSFDFSAQMRAAGG